MLEAFFDCSLPGVVHPQEMEDKEFPNANEW
jgi:hypothetical protein